MLETTRSLIDKTVQNALDLAKSANSAFRSHDDVAVPIVGGMFGHVQKGRLVSFGLEPVGDVVVDRTRKVFDLDDGSPGHLLWGRIAAVAGGADRSCVDGCRCRDRGGRRSPSGVRHRRCLTARASLTGLTLRRARLVRSADFARPAGPP